MANQSETKCDICGASQNDRREHLADKHPYALGMFDQITAAMPADKPPNPPDKPGPAPADKPPNPPDKP